jgi:hypothetical protein
MQINRVSMGWSYNQMKHRLKREVGHKGEYFVVSFFSLEIKWKDSHFKWSYTLNLFDKKEVCGALMSNISSSSCTIIKMSTQQTNGLYCVSSAVRFHNSYMC